MRIVGIVQARMGSERLPGKVLRPLGDRSVLAWVIRAARAAGCLDDLIVATSDRPEDAAVAAECDHLGVRVFRGPAEDVLTRFVGALSGVLPAQGRGFDAVMRFNADCPLLDPEVIRTAVRHFTASPGLDYLSTSLHRVLPLGTDVEIVSVDALRRADRLATGFHRTHVTSYVYTHPEDFTVTGIALPPDRSGLRVTLDTIEDWRLIEAVVAHFGDRIVGVGELSAWLDANPDVRALNGEVRQKALADR
ncbi:spore coat polysaccharide biosynthesis protein SpsF [Catenuloplanes nepalensis]|uniref:Spore coat polysaccharide biosynthesis protein SpsF n=1 Tax=Catenuloplanes nepalensis TaxID=587533 RepID=A0ABT9N288_9ACTN|nr:glycosyltransferase family protein [Catenuloplanes nepalensis]MDP9797812.1 spore coat polysaccharide biosynthesis protein SpsF [Catenuloplanes nepalensis]